jgi:predicted RNase H-like HicB family nuclease
VRLKAVVHQAAEGGFWAEVPALPGCCSQGNTHEELLQNLREAAEGFLACGLAPAQATEATEAAEAAEAAAPAVTAGLGDLTVEIEV